MPWIRAATDSCEGMRLVILFCLSEFSRFGEMAALRLDEMTHVKEEIGEIYPFSVEGGGGTTFCSLRILPALKLELQGYASFNARDIKPLREVGRCC